MLRLEIGAGASDRLAAAIAAADLASVILVASPGSALSKTSVAPLIATGQASGVAMLIEADAELARASGADGIHLPVCDHPLDVLRAARATLGVKSIVGADAGRSRHDAMSLGEDGADYVAFGLPPFVEEGDEALERQIAIVAWWAEIFEVPCVAMDVSDIAAAQKFAHAGADFVCLSPLAGTTLDSLAAETRAMVRALDEMSTQFPATR